ncbi:helicase associated domain-containing protein [Streptomyces sp. NPDC059740]|uniref:helicase associated domain-containing protein n=1 Tax=Streptomyces sp. NPDC059740 TaxID=3346926 RepID=UPI00365FF405
MDWQRHYAGLRTLLDSGGTLDVVLPGVTYRGDDIGAWLRKQRNQWDQLNAEQQRRLTALGVTPVPRPAKAPERPSGGAARAGRAPVKVKGSAAFQRGLDALQQFVEREGHVKVPRQHTEHLPPAATGAVGAGRPEQQGAEGVPVRLGVFLSNTRQRREKLTDEQRAALADLGVPWAG